MTRLLGGFRVVARFVAAALFWAHASFIIYGHFPMATVAAKMHLMPGETTIIFVLILLTVLTSYGMWNFALDLAYVYAFPFIIVYYAWRITVPATVFAYHVFHPGFQPSTAVVPPPRAP